MIFRFISLNLLKSPQGIFFFNCISGFEVHVKDMQDCCIGTHVAVWFAAFLPFNLYLAFLPMLSFPNSPPLRCPSPISPQQTPVWCSPPCVHVFSLFNTHLWVRTCDVWFSVLVSVYWEWWFLDSSMSYKGHKLINSYGYIVLHGVYVPHFIFPVYHRWAFELVPGLCYRK